MNKYGSHNFREKNQRLLSITKDVNTLKEQSHLDYSKI